MSTPGFEGRSEDESWELPELEGWRHDPATEADDALMEYLGIAVDGAEHVAPSDQDIRSVLQESEHALRIDIAILLAMSHSRHAPQPLPEAAQRKHLPRAMQRRVQLGVEELDPR